MPRMCQSVDLFVLSCLFLTVESQQGHILPPQNVSLKWMTDFKPELSWAPPPHSVENCSYVINANNKDPKYDIRISNIKVTLSSREFDFVMEGGFLQVAVQTVCSSNYSEPVKVKTDYPVLVRNLECYIYAATQTNCTWLADSQAQDLRFFYRLSNWRKGGPSSPLQECSSYHRTGDVRTGCVVEANIEESIRIVFNGTLNDTLAKNTFERRTFRNVRPPALHWTVTKTRDRFHIEWTPPDIRTTWTYIITYTECNELKTKHVTDQTGNSTDLVLVSDCQYRMTIKATTGGRGETPESDEKFFDADTDPNAWYALIIIPLMLAGLAALMIVCCRKNKEYIFPKVPGPRDLLSDISNNNNNNKKSTVHDLYVPAKEEDNCKITLVVDPLINRLDF